MNVIQRLNALVAAAGTDEYPKLQAAFLELLWPTLPFIERCPDGWELRDIVQLDGRYTTTLAHESGTTVHGLCPDLETSIDLAIQRAKEFTPLAPYLGRLAHAHRDAENRWILTDKRGRVAGAHNLNEALEMLGLTFNPC